MDSFPYKHIMFMIINLIEPRIGNLILNNFFWTNFSIILFVTSFLDSRFQNLPDSEILQKYQSLSNKSFKCNSVYISFLNLTRELSFEPRNIVIIFLDFFIFDQIFLSLQV